MRPLLDADHSRPATAYYFLQTGEYEHDEALRAAARPKVTESDDEFLKSLVPSYLNIDYQGRVVRIDTFSSASAPYSSSRLDLMHERSRRDDLPWLASRLDDLQPHLRRASRAREREQHAICVWVCAGVGGQIVGGGVGFDGLFEVAQGCVPPRDLRAASALLSAALLCPVGVDTLTTSRASRHQSPVPRPP